MAKKRLIIEDVPVVDVAAKGGAIAKKDGMVIVTDTAVPGDIVDIQVHKKRKGMHQGGILKIKSYSPDRIMPVCSHFGTCGGCSWQNMNYAAQLRYKEKSVRDSLERIGKVDTTNMHPILPSPRTEYYRNRLDFAFSSKRWLYPNEIEDGRFVEKPGLGFHVPGRFDKVLDVHRCYLHAEPSNTIRLAIRQYALTSGFAFYDPRTHTGFMRSLVIRTALAGEVMLLVIFGEDRPQEIEEVMEFCKRRFPFVTSLYYVVNTKANDTVYDLEHVLYFGKQELEEVMNGVRYRIGPKSFFQTNPFQAERLFGIVKKLASLTGNELVYDLYCGVGSIALQVASGARKVVGIETVEEAIMYADMNAGLNDNLNTHFVAGDVKDILSDELIAEHGLPDLLITDPPRVGMDPRVVERLLELAPERIIYVSCNPATQARDLLHLSEKYELRHIQPVDMFPHTYHVENVVELVKKEG